MKVFFSDKMNAQAESFSPSAGKPAQAVASWLELVETQDFASLQLVEPEPASFEQLCLAHDEAFVRGILSGTIANGFGNRDLAVAASLPYTSGAMLAAARDAIAGGDFACAPVSGFHHAGWKRAGGFCTFNGLMVTALTLLHEGVAERAGILDCDQHYGDGTDAIIDHLKIGGRVKHYTAGKHRHKPARFLADLADLTASFSNCDVLLYQAGADPHIDDPLGGWMTTEELRIRDHIVFKTARAIGLPAAWNLAGGYQRDKEGGIRPVLDIHDNTMQECLSVLRLSPRLEGRIL